MHRFVTNLFYVPIMALVIPASLLFAGPDGFTPGKTLWNGQQAYIAVDHARNVMHIAYLNGDGSALEYRTGDLAGNFGEPEKAMPMKMVSPRIVLDENGIPHLVAATNMWSGMEKIYYTNRIDGSWKTPLKVMDGTADRTENTINPNFALGPGNRAYISCQVSHSGHRGAIFRVDNINTTPTVTKKAFADNTMACVLYFIGDELWGITGWDGRSFSRYDTETLKPIGKKYSGNFAGHGEGLGGSLDHLGDFHAGGLSTGKSGTYTRLSWAKSGGKTIGFGSTNGHENGIVVPIRDRVAKDRVYVFYFNGGTEGGANPNVIKDCAADNQVQFMRVDNGEKATEDNPVTDNPAPHGRSARTPPAVAAHPGGGVIVVHEMCPKSTDPAREWTTRNRTLMFTIVGESSTSTFGAPSLRPAGMRHHNAGTAASRSTLRLRFKASAMAATGCYSLRGDRLDRSRGLASGSLIVVAPAR